MPVLLAVLQAPTVTTTVVAWVPQARAGLQARSTVGVSRSAWLIAAALGVTWSIYGALNGVWVLAASEGVFAAGAVAVLCTLVPPRRAVAGVLAAALVGVAAVVALPPVVFAVAGVVASVAVRLAQLARMLHRRDASGVADASWWLLTVALSCWGVFALLADKPALAIGSLLGVLSSVAVVTVSARMRPARALPESA